MPSLPLFLPRPFEEPLALVVEYRYHAGDCLRPPELEIESVTDERGREVALSASETEWVEEQCLLEEEPPR